MVNAAGSSRRSADPVQQAWPSCNGSSRLTTADGPATFSHLAAAHGIDAPYAIATADAILLRPPPAIRKLPADELGQLTELPTRLLEVETAEPEDPKSSESDR